LAVRATIDDGKEQLIVRQISRRMGEVDSSVSDRIARLTPAQLDDLGEALLDFTNVADLDRWLANHTKAKRSARLEQ